MKPGIYSDIDNDTYHSMEGISKSGLDMIDNDPASYIWAKNAPRTVVKCLDFGSAVHAYLLEPDLFKSDYVKAPELNLRTNQGKADKLAFDEENKDKFIITHEEGKKIALMADSVMAHPTAKRFFEADFKAEQSFFWNDPDTGELCRCRPDMDIFSLKMLVDLKTVADMGRVQRHIEEFRYYVQDAFYTDGVKAVTGEDYDFVFLFVSTSLNCGRYPVQVVRLSAAAKFDGRAHYRRNLDEYSSRMKSGDWESITEMDRPYWATKNEDVL